MHTLSRQILIIYSERFLFFLDWLSESELEGSPSLPGAAAATWYRTLP
jgi:hypothetical protein